MGLPLTGQVYAYDAYGNQITGTGLTTASAALTTLPYSGEQRDFTTKLDNLRARPYSFETGLFPRMDDFAGLTNDPQSFHKYLYVHADPIGNTDPSGNISVTASLGAISITSALAAVYIPAVGTALQRGQSIAANGTQSSLLGAVFDGTVTRQDFVRAF